jgi:hypothetical protein
MTVKKPKYIVDPRPPRVDWTKLGQGPTSEDLKELPATTADDWRGAEVVIPIDEATYREFQAFLAMRRRTPASS